MSDRTEISLRQAILMLLAQQEPGKTICPSEAPRHVFGEAGDWRDHMDLTREVAAGLVAEGRIETTQKGTPVDIAAAKGPIRLRLVS